MVKEIENKLVSQVEAYRLKLEIAKAKYEESICDQGQVKYDLNAMVEQLSSSVAIGYNLDMDSLNNEANKRGFGE